MKKDFNYKILSKEYPDNGKYTVHLQCTKCNTKTIISPNALAKLKYGCKKCYENMKSREASEKYTIDKIQKIIDEKSLCYKILSEEYPDDGKYIVRLQCITCKKEINLHPDALKILTFGCKKCYGKLKSAANAKRKEETGYVNQGLSKYTIDNIQKIIDDNELNYKILSTEYPDDETYKVKLQCIDCKAKMKAGDDKMRASYRKNEEGEFERDIAIDRIYNLNNSLIIIDEA
ncbi:unnamed protein product, partial [marine sediment metagenome]